MTPHPTAVVTDDTFAYVSTDGFIWKVPLAGGQATPLASNVSAWSIAIDSDQVFFTEDRYGVSRVSKSGGPVVRISDAQSTAGIAVDDAHVYWNNGAHVARMDKDGGSPIPFVDGVNVENVIVDNTHVYWTEVGLLDLNPGPIHGQVSRVAKDGGVERLSVGITIFSQHGLASDDEAAYWSGGNWLKANSIFRFDKATGNIRPLTVQPDQYPARYAADHVEGMAVDGQRVYWTDFVSGGIFAVDKSGGPIVVVVYARARDLGLGASGPAATPKGITVHNGILYWAEYGTGRVCKAPALP